MSEGAGGPAAWSGPPALASPSVRQEPHVLLRSFDWLIAVLADPDVPDKVKLTAMSLPGRTARGAGTSGQRVQPIPEATAIVRGLSVRTVERHLAMLEQQYRLLERTRPAAQGHPAEYRLLGPERFVGAGQKRFGDEILARQPDKGTAEDVGRQPDTATRSDVGRPALDPWTQPDTAPRADVGRLSDTPDRIGGSSPPWAGGPMSDHREQENNPPPPTTEDLTHAPTREAPEVEGAEAVTRAVRIRSGVLLDVEQVAELDSRLEQGWTVDQLIEALTERLGSAGVPAAVVRSRLRKLPTAAPTSRGRPPQRLPWCEACNPVTRMVEDDEGRPSRCPDCHPQAHGAP